METKEQVETAKEPTTTTVVEGERKSLTDTIGDRMKSYEAKTMFKLDPNLPFIIRLDGHKFSSYTRPFNRPFDQRISNVMVATTIDLLNAFNPTTAFTCSDEITLLFPVPPPEPEDNTTDKEKTDAKKKEEERVLMYSGKIQKIASLTAGFASAAFNRHMATQTFDPETEPKLHQHVTTQMPYFDSRIFQVPGNYELINNVVWRCHFDYRRNSISGLARCHFSTKELHKMSSPQQLEKLKEKGVLWEDMPDAYKYGTFIKKEQYEIEAQNDKGEKVKALRHRVVTKSFDMAGLTEANEKFVVAKYLNE